MFMKSGENELARQNKIKHTDGASTNEGLFWVNEPVSGINITT